MKRTIGLVLAGLFAVFGLLQLNDVDPEFWVTLYLLVAAIVGSAALGYFRAWAAWLALVICVGWMFYLLPELINWINMGMPTITGQMKATEPHVEFTREFFGLLMMALALGWTLWANRAQGLFRFG